MIKASYKYQKFNFKSPSGTSRGVLTEKHAWFITIQDSETVGIGECSIIPGLSPDYLDFNHYTSLIQSTCDKISRGEITIDNCAGQLIEYPSICFGVETAFAQLLNKGTTYFNTPFSTGEDKIAINGLIWMGSEDFMQEQIEAKIEAGFTTIKMKVGAIDFKKELKLLEGIRSKFDQNKITLRVDANGAFSPDDALVKLNALSELDIHSIEQPIKAGQQDAMKALCEKTPLPIALDEELIGINDKEAKRALLAFVRPQFIILKPSLHGGISGTREWIELSEQFNIPWWMTSALESNIGLQAICEFTSGYKNSLPQGLGTGSLYTDNIPSQLKVENGFIFLSKD